MAAWHALGNDVFCWHDCCNVYLLRDGARGLLIDLGSGSALDHLREVGVERIEGVYFTHAHRDQCQGAAKALAQGITLHFPAAARSMVDADQRADFRMLSPAHFAYPCRFHPPLPLPEALFDLADWQSLAFGPFDIIVHAAPGHIDHQLAFHIETSAASYLCCGDAMHSRGKVHEAFCLETDHYTGAGARLGADTLCALRNLRPDHLCPSHGPVTSEGVWDAFCVTIDRLRELADLKDTIVPRRPAVQRLVRPRANTMIQVSEHLWMWNNSYFLLSDDGPVLMVDVQCILPESFHEQYRATFGERPIEVVLVSHLHCDHVMGIEELRAHHPLQCWAQEALVGAIEHPYDFARPWLHNNPTKVDRPLAHGEVVRWHEYELTAWWFPGQTDFHDAFSLTIDGHRALFSGDNFYPAQQWGGTGGQCGYNGSHPDNWRRSAELVMELEPEWILASHMQPFEYRRADWEAIVDWSERIAALMRDIAPDGNLERHHSPHFVSARPYVQILSTQVTNPIKVTWHNRYDHVQVVGIAARLPAGLAVDRAQTVIEVPAGESRGVGFLVTAEAGLQGMQMVTFDLTVNGEPWGELAECYLRGKGRYEGEAG